MKTWKEIEEKYYEEFKTTDLTGTIFEDWIMDFFKLEFKQILEEMIENIPIIDSDHTKLDFVCIQRRYEGCEDCNSIDIKRQLKDDLDRFFDNMTDREKMLDKINKFFE